MGRTLALDIGTKRTGAAISDDLNITAQAVGVRKRTGFKSDLAWVTELMELYEIDRVIVGHPVNMDGSRGERAIATERFAGKLAKTVPVEVVLWDERLTTVAAERALLESNMSRGKRKKVIDQVAAQLILSSWMDAHKISGAP